MPALRVDPLRMSVGAQLAVLFVLIGVPGIVFGLIAFRVRSKERRRDAYLWDVADRLRGGGWDPLGDGFYRKEKKHVKVEAGTNPLFSNRFSVRIAAYSPTVHEFELKRNGAVEPGAEPFASLLDRWESAGKMHVECYAAGVTERTDLCADLDELHRLAEQPLSKTWSGGTFTIREGFEKKVPQWHWRHDQRPLLPPEARRWCVSYWHGDPYLNTGIFRLIDLLSEGRRRFYISDSDDLRFLEYAFGRRDIAVWGTLVELPRNETALAADRYLDGRFFGGLLVAGDVPRGFEDVKRFRFHDRAIEAIPRVDFYMRRLFDDEFSWYSGEYEIVSVRPLDVPGALAKVAAEFGAQVLPIDRRFNKRIVVPLEY